jgi:hypothetical protein
VTITYPVVAPTGTVVTILVLVHAVGVARIPLNITVLGPCVDPKFVPVIVTDVPICSKTGDKPAIVGAFEAGTTVIPVLPVTFPSVALIVALPEPTARVSPCP